MVILASLSIIKPTACNSIQHRVIQEYAAVTAAAVELTSPCMAIE